MPFPEEVLIPCISNKKVYFCTLNEKSIFHTIFPGFPAIIPALFFLFFNQDAFLDPEFYFF